MPTRSVRLTVSTADGHITLMVHRDRLVREATIPYDEPRVTKAAHALVEVMARGARRRSSTAACHNDMRTHGEELFRALFPPAIREELAELEGRAIRLELDESLIHIPWELVHDGHAFLCRRFDLGRVVFPPPDDGRTVVRPARLLVVCSDARGDLPAIAAEGQTIADVLDGHKAIVAQVVHDRPIAEVRALLKEHDLVHFAGPGEYLRADPDASGWRLADGLLDAGALEPPVPLVVFTNACVSSHEPNWSDENPRRVYGIARAFLRAGSRHHHGTVWDIAESQARIFARAFYGELTRGRTIGGSVRRAREAIIAGEGPGTLGWATYVLYGDPAYAPFSATDARPVASGVPTTREMAERDWLKGVVKQLRPARRNRVPIWLALLFVAVVAAGAAAALLVR